MTGILLTLSNLRSVITLTVVPPNAYAVGFGDGSLTTNSVTVTPSGGVGAYTYLWTKTSGDTIAVTSSTSATTTFSGAVVFGDVLGAEYKCTVTDSIGSTAEISVSVSLVEIS